MESTEPIRSRKRQDLYIVLCCIFITNALLAEIIGVKIFSFEHTLGLPPAQIPVNKDYVLDFNLTAGVVIWPFVFIFTDIINEYFGPKGVRKISVITAALICYVFFIVWIVTKLEPANFWLEFNSEYDNGKPFNPNAAFNKLLTQGMGIMIGSVTAFLLGQLLDAWVFYKLKVITGSKMIWLRATGSTLISQLMDSFVVLFIAFYLFSNWPIQQVFAVALINYIYKVGAAIFLIPILYLVHYLIDKYLSKQD